MELCETCKTENCSKKLKITQQGNLLIIKCLDYEKDESKIQGYRNQLERTVDVERCVMKGLISDWSKL